MTERMKNIIRGAGSLISVNVPAIRREVHSQYNPAKTSREALCGDMERIGADLKKTIRKAANGEE